MMIVRRARRAAVSVMTVLFIAGCFWTAPLWAAEPVEHVASVQMYIGKFLRTMFTYSVPGDVRNFAESEKFMVDETAERWREWYSGWLKNAGFTRSTSEIEIGQILVNPRRGPNGEIRARVPVATYTSILGKSFESSGMVYITLLPVPDAGMGVGIVRHESDEGGLFEVSPSGVSVKSAMGEQQFNRMVLDAGS